MRIDITNKRFGKLVAISPTEKRIKGETVWLFQCDCGNSTEKKVSSVRKQHKPTRSCGCLIKETATKHGDRGKRLNNIYLGMKSRCNLITNGRYHQYGGRGISISDDFDTYEKFKSWALSNGYNDKLTIERIDVNEPYSIANCAWVDNKAQARNRRNKVLDIDTVSCIKTYFKYTTLSNKELANIFGVKIHTIKSLSNSWLDVEPLPI